MIKMMATNPGGIPTTVTIKIEKKAVMMELFILKPRSPAPYTSFCHKGI
jgi:hypothetical protein